MSLASRLPYDHPYAGGFSGIGSQPLPTDADALDYLSRMATADGAGVETGVAVAVDAFFRDSKAAGVFSALKACCILCGARTLAGALVPVVGTAPTSNGFVEGDYSRTAGLAGDGTSYLDSRRASNADGLNNQHIAVNVSAPATLATAMYIGADGGSSANVEIYKSSSDLVFRSRAGSTATAAGSGSQTGFLALSRSDSAAFSYRFAGGDYEAEITSIADSAETLFVLSRNRLGVASFTADGTVSFYSIGTGIGSAGLAALDTAVNNLITSIGEAL